MLQQIMYVYVIDNANCDIPLVESTQYGCCQNTLCHRGCMLKCILVGNTGIIRTLDTTDMYMVYPEIYNAT